MTTATRAELIEALQDLADAVDFGTEEELASALDAARKVLGK